MLLQFSAGAFFKVPACHRSRCSPIIKHKNEARLTTISAFRNSKDIKLYSDQSLPRQCLPQQFLPGKLFSFLPPTIVITFIRNLWNKVNGRSIIKIPANFQPSTPFPLLRGPSHADRENNGSSAPVSTAPFISPNNRASQHLVPSFQEVSNNRKNWIKVYPKLLIFLPQN